MKIAVFTECYRPIVNGVVVSVQTFTQELTKQGHDVHIYAPAYPGYRDSEPRVHRLPSVSPPTRPRYPLAVPFSSLLLRRAFAARPPDIIHAQHPFITGREARRIARWLDRPLVFTYHTLIRAYAHYVPLPRVLVQAMAVRVSRDFPNSADCVVVPTRAVAEVLRSYGVRRPIEVIPTGIDLDLIDGSPRASVRPLYGIPEGVPVVAFAGRIAREKSVDSLIRALGLLSRRLPEAHLLFVGGGPWYAPCRDLAASLGLAERVHFTGYLSRLQVFDCLAASQAFAFPSLTDTQGVAVLEAMALKCPPVVVRSGAVADVVEDGVNGLVVEPTDEALAEGLAAMLESADLRHRVAGQARQRAEEFSSGRMTARLVRVYEGLVSR